MQRLVHLMLSQRSLRLSSFLFIFFFILFGGVISIILSSRSLIHSSALVILLIDSFSCIFHFSYCIVYLCLFFSSSRSLLSISCIFSILPSILFPRSSILFTIIILNSVSGRLPASTLFSCVSRVLSCPFVWDITLFLFISSKFFVIVVFILQAAGL